MEGKKEDDERRREKGRGWARKVRSREQVVGWDGMANGVGKRGGGGIVL